MRATLTTISVAVLVATSAGPAAARPADMPPGHGPSASHSAASPSLGVQHRYLGGDAVAVPTTHRSAAAPAGPVARTQIADEGVDWTDVGIGAGRAAALLLSAAGVSAVRHPRAMRVP